MNQPITRHENADLPADEASALDKAWRLQRSGNFVAAFDLAQEALHRWPESQSLQHVSILALASCGSTHAALAAFRATSLAAAENEDLLALEARLLKDLAFQCSGPASEALLSQAAGAYERIALRTGGSYTAQNAAFLWVLAGAGDRAARLAQSVIADLARSAIPADAQAKYFHWATLAEAALVLGDRAALEAAIGAANPLCRRNLWARTRTFAQLRRLQRLRPDCADLVERWYRPSIGFVLDPAQTLPAFAARPSAEAADAPALAYATGSDREQDWQALAAREIQLHVVIANAPVADATVAPGHLVSPGHFIANRQASGHRTAYTWSSLLLDDGDDEQHACAEAALGLSFGHADTLEAPWVVLHRSSAGWNSYGGVEREPLVAGIAAMRNATAERARYGFLFADAVGYSTLSAGDTRRYWTRLLPETAAAVLRRHADAVLLRKTWGDAVHGVFRTATAAAAAALEMTAATTRLVDELEFGRRLAFRVAAHFGAADTGLDPVEDAPSFFGPQLSFAARIVPVAPPGGVFVTEAFAAQLSLEGAAGIGCTYVGTTSLAKGYGRVRLLALSSRSA